jgi:predicted enzyme related to lactoylglutathione lyase
VYLSQSSIGQIAITVADVSAALHFYRDILGLKFLIQPGPNLAFLQAGNIRLMISTPQGYGKVGANSILYFSVHDIVGVHESLVWMGAPSERSPQLAATMPDHDLWLAFLKDPDGNLVGLMEEKKRDL